MVVVPLTLLDGMVELSRKGGLTDGRLLHTLADRLAIRRGRLNAHCLRHPLDRMECTKLPTMKYQHNSIGRDSSDRNACFVKALAEALDTSYDDAYDAVAEAGRKRHHTTPWSAVASVLDSLGLRLINSDRLTLARWAEQHPDGVYLVFTVDHALVVKNGVVYDSNHSRPRCKVRRYVHVL